MILTENKIILIVSILAVILRISASIYTNNIFEQEHYEYGSLAENMRNGKGYSLFHFEGDNLTHHYSENSIPFPSAYMPFGYPILISPAFLFSNSVISNSYILFLNIFFDILSIILLYRFTKQIFNKNIAIISIIIFAIIPEFIYSSTLTSTTSVYHFFILLILNLLFEYIQKQSLKNLILIAFSFGFFLLFRSEPVIFLIIVAIYLMKFKNFFHIIVLIAIPFTMLIPFQVRNYIVFDKFIPMTTSAGLNLYRGNNPEHIGNWGNDEIFQYRHSLRNDKNYEIKLNEFYTEKSIIYIKNNKLHVFKNSIVKLYHLWIFNSIDERTTRLIYLIPWIVLLSAFLFSFKLIKLKQVDLLLIFLLYSTITAMIFFALPRYQTMMKIAIIPFAAVSIHFLINKLTKK